MIEFNRYERNPLAPQVFVSKIGSIWRINPHVVKVTMCQMNEFTQNGEATLVEAVSLIWENSEWDSAFDQFQWAHGEVRKGTFFDGDIRKRAQ